MKYRATTFFTRIASKSKTGSEDSRNIAHLLHWGGFTPKQRLALLDEFKHKAIIRLTNKEVQCDGFTEEARCIMSHIYSSMLARWDEIPHGIVQNNTNYDYGVITGVSYSSQTTKGASKTADVVFEVEGEFINVFFHFTVSLGNGFYTTWRTSSTSAAGKTPLSSLLQQQSW